MKRKKIFRSNESSAQGHWPVCIGELELLELFEIKEGKYKGPYLYKGTGAGLVCLSVCLSAVCLSLSLCSHTTAAKSLRAQR